MEPDPRTVNYGLAGGRLDATKHVERAMRTVLLELDRADIDRMLEQLEAWANDVWET